MSKKSKSKNETQGAGNHDLERKLKEDQERSYRKQGHAAAVTRREFISRGFMAGLSVSMVPSTLMALLKPSLAGAAVTCPSSGAAPGLIPLIVLDMAGGLALPGNFMVGSKLGAQDYLASYSTLGIPDANNPKNVSGQVDTRFGAPMHSVLSKFFAGMITTNMSADTQNKTRIMTVCHNAQDDTPNNPLSPLILASKAGLLGTILPSGIGSSASVSGGNSTVPFVESAFKPLPISNPTSLVDALSYNQALSGLNVDQKAKIAKAAGNLSQGQLSKFQSMSQGEQFAALANCGYVKLPDVVANAGVLDASKNASVQAVYGTAATQTQAAVVYNALMGNTGPGAIVIGNCDYHNLGQTVTDAKDLEAGVALGRILELANRLGKPVAVVGITDGGCSSISNTRLWNSDSGVRGMSFLACMLPGGAPSLVNSQIGSYTAGQVADGTNFFSKDASMIAYVLIANYLKLSNRMDLFPSIIPSAGVFPVDRVNEIIGFG